MTKDTQPSEAKERKPAAESGPAASNGNSAVEETKKRANVDNQSHRSGSMGSSKKKSKKSKQVPSKEQSRTHRADGRVYVERNSLEEAKLLRERDEIRARMEAKGPEGITQDDLVEERRAANRLSAFQSRQRRNNLIKDLQTKVAELTRDNEESEEVIRQLRQELEESRSENEALRKHLRAERAHTSNGIAPARADIGQQSVPSQLSQAARGTNPNRSPPAENPMPFLQAMLSALSNSPNQAMPHAPSQQQLQFQANAPDTNSSSAQPDNILRVPQPSNGAPSGGAMQSNLSHPAPTMTAPQHQAQPGQLSQDNQRLLESLLSMLHK